MGIISDNADHIAVEVLTGSFLGVPWSPWSFALQDFEVQSGENRWTTCPVLDGRTSPGPMTADVYLLSPMQWAPDSDASTLVLSSEFLDRVKPDHYWANESIGRQPCKCDLGLSPWYTCLSRNHDPRTPLRSLKAAADGHISAYLIFSIPPSLRSSGHPSAPHRTGTV